MSGSDEPVWSMVMFDLPVKTKTQRRQATQFRELLLDNGYQMVQYSVYARFSPSTNSIIPTINVVRRNVPPGGEVRVLTVTDHQWAHTLRFANQQATEPEVAPVQLTIF